MIIIYSLKKTLRKSLFSSKDSKHLKMEDYEAGTSIQSNNGMDKSQEIKSAEQPGDSENENGRPQSSTTCQQGEKKEYVRLKFFAKSIFRLKSKIFHCRFAVSMRWEKEVLENGPIKDYHRYFCCCARRVGNMFILIEKRDGSPCVIAGPCWPFCMGVTVPLILGISALVCIFILFNDESGVVCAQITRYFNISFISLFTCSRNGLAICTFLC